MPDLRLQQFLADRDVPCPLCGYNLRGLANEKCPECNQRLELQVGLIDPVGKSWLVGLIGLAFGAGFFDLAVAIVVFMSLHENDWPPFRQIWPIYLSSAILSFALIGWVRMRNRVRKMPLGVQSWVATCCWIATIVCVGAMLYVGTR
jgi:hypothetical protein